MAQAPTPPPQRFAQGGRQVLDAQWLAYLVQTRDIGDGAALGTTGLFMRGINEFNEARFQASHETWEALWVDAAYPERLFLLALTKLGAGFAHALRRNPKGVRRLLDDALRFARPFAPQYAGVDMERLLTDVGDWLKSGFYGPPFPELTVIGERSRPTETPALPKKDGV